LSFEKKEICYFNLSKEKNKQTNLLGVFLNLFGKVMCVFEKQKKI
jgi:hypothetical protein